MKIGKDSAVVKRRFGSFLRESRLQYDWGLYDVGRMLSVSNQTVHNWETGFSFPRSIVLLKKLCLLYDKVPDTVKELGETMVVRSERQKQFMDMLTLNDRDSAVGTMVCRYECKDERDTKYKIQFGKYLRKSRQDSGISTGTLARALGVQYVGVLAWESGTNFPQSVVTLSLLDGLYGDLFDVLFGLCKSNGIHLDGTEARKVLKFKKEVAGKPRWSEAKAGLWRG